MIRLSIGAASDVGRLRTENQDCAFISEWLVAVADGMGGPPAGDVASKVAAEALRSTLAAPSIVTLADAVQWANQRVWEEAERPDYRGMGTTLCALALVHHDDDQVGVALANVGDSRIYLLHDGELVQLTDDHSLVEEMVRDGRITADEALVHGQRNIVTRVLGLGPDVEVDTWEREPVLGDRYLLCSDGLFNEVDASRIAATLRRLADPTETAHELVSMANQNGGRDNITCIVVDVVDQDDPTAAVPPAERILQPRPETVGDLAGFTAAVAAFNEQHGTADDDSYDSVDDDDRSLLPPGTVDDPATRPRLVTWRTGLFLLAVVAVFATAAGAVAWYGRNGYFIDVDEAGEIAVFQGRPGGLLWFDPTFVESTGVPLDDLTPALRDSIEGRPEFASFAEAERYLANLAEQLDRARPTTTTTTAATTTTTADATTTTGP